MSQDWEKLHAILYGNITAAMHEWLGLQLGVSAEALRMIQVGWAPTVQFKKVLRYGYFTTPMRDSEGRIIGFSLRDREGDKCVWPGSSLGCMYVINPKHKKGDRGYGPGSHNWIRTMDAHELCPVCGKPDGCLLSNDDPTDPKAVICRVKSSDRKMKFGWLHIRKPEGNISSEAMIGGTGPVLSVEGMSDVAAAYDLGLDAVGRPNDRGGQDITAELVRGRQLIVMGENDKKSDGKWPGRDGMIAMYTFARTKTYSAKMLMPPHTAKDLRGWKANGLTREEFDAYLEKHGEETVDGTVLPDNDPMTVARAFMKDNYSQGKRFLLIRWGGSWYRYVPDLGRYETLTDDEILRKDVYLWGEGKQYITEGPKGDKTVPLHFNTTSWSNFQQAGAAIARPVPEIKSIPAWINGAKGPDVKNLVMFSNGTLNVPPFLEGQDEKHYMVKPTPDLFNTASLPIPFDPAALCPLWLAFLQSSIGDEISKIHLLQEWIGYCLTSDTSMQKMMYLVGKTGAGKGTIIDIMQALVGREQSSATSLTQLAEQFGLAPLMGKMICVIADAREAKHDALRGFEVLLGLTGEDQMQINRKFKDQLPGELITARVTMASNHFLNLPDPNGALPRRLNIITFPHQATEVDTNLRTKLRTELEGIAIWALDGLKRLREQGKFTLPASSEAAITEWNRISNPLVAFWDDCILARENVIVQRDQLYDCWSGWTRDTHRASGTRAIFLRQFADYFTLKSVGEGFKGIDIVQSAARKYLGKP